MNSYPSITVVLAMSLDGKIADASRSAARFGSSRDRQHLETQIAAADAVLFGAGTLRSYGTTLSVSSPDLLAQRQQQGKPPQPVQIVCSRAADIPSDLPFFTQPVPHWLLTTAAGAKRWQDRPGFDRILTAESNTGELDWNAALHQLATEHLHQVAVLGGGELVASLSAANLIDDLWLTVCPLILGGQTAPTPVEGLGFPESLAPRLELLSVEAIDQEVFLHYKVCR
jgi:5-amino-6-(5-phosphoribosylamino)uracil reductase